MYKTDSERKISLGLLILRIGVGLAFVVHGYPKIFGGPEKWTGVGQMALTPFGIDYAHTFFGLMAALSEFGGGLCVALGILFRPACVLMAVTMAMATNMHLNHGDDFGKYSHALELFFVFVGLTLTGAGDYSMKRSK